jgi:hypothetical protein
MSLFDQIFKNTGMSMFRRVLGDAAVYEPGFGAAKATWAILNRSVDNVGQFGERLENRLTAQLPKADVPEPQPGDALTVGATTYRIDQTVNDDGLFVEVAIR